MVWRNQMAKKSTTEIALKKLESKLECCICFNHFKQPKLLPCFHVFCKSPCLEQLVAKDGCSLTCPICQYIVPLSEKGVDGLQTDFHIEPMIEIREALCSISLPEPTDSEKRCGSCENGKATGYCRDCGDFLCNECQAAHKKMKKLKGHSLLSLEEYRSQGINTAPPKPVPKCPKHPENALKIYCETCSTMICTDCTIRLHKDHNYDLLADVFHKHKEELVSSLKPVEEKLVSVQQVLDTFDARAKEISDQRATLQASIQKEMDEQHKLFEKRQAQLMHELDSLTQQKLKTLAAQRSQVEISQTRINNCLKYAEDLQTGTASDLLEMKAPVLKRIKQITSEIDASAIKPEVEADLELVTDTVKQAQLETWIDIREGGPLALEESRIAGDGLKGASVGEQKCVIFHAKTAQSKEYKGHLDLKAELEHIQTKDCVQCEVVQQQNGQYKINYQPVKRGKHKLTLIADEYPVRGSPFPTAVTPSKYSISKPDRIVRGLDRPRNTTVNSKGQIIAVHGNGCCVSILTPEGEKIRTFGFGTKESGKGQLKNAYGVTVDKDDNIYVAGCDNHAILKYSPEGRFIAAVGCNGHKQLRFHSPVGIVYNHRDNYLYVADQCNHRIQVLTTDLRFVRVFGIKGHRGGEFNLTFNIAFDDTNKLYVTDHFNHRVQVLTTEGQFLRVFSRKADGQQLRYPWAIAIDSSNTVYVSEDGPYCVSVFTSQGDYITTFGGEGSEEGHFQKIYGLYIDDNDTIFASDLNNGRLQIY